MEKFILSKIKDHFSDYEKFSIIDLGSGPFKLLSKILLELPNSNRVVAVDNDDDNYISV